MFDVGVLELVVLGVVALLVFGPERLPRVTARAAAMLRQLREQAVAAREEITSSVDLDATGLKDLADLHPRRIARSVLEPSDEDATESGTATSRRHQPARQPDAAPPSPSKPSASPGPTEPAAPFDPDAT